MIGTATRLCFGTTTGRLAPSLIITMCEPLVRRSSKPHATNTRTRVRQ